MSVLHKAELIELTLVDPPEPVGDPVPVQLNPTTLNLRISNRTEGGDAQGRPSRQYIATSTVLTLDLVFDTADEGTTDRPRSVRERTAIVEKYVLPRNQGTEVPPKLRFRWGDGLSFDGVVGSVTIDFEHFAADGTPLRAKVGLSLTEQDAKYKVVPSSAKAKAPSPGGLLPGMPGSAGLGLSAGLSAGFSAGIGVSLSASASVGVALGGETAVDFAARVGLDPTAWRALDADLGGDLTLQAGVEVGFDTSVAASAGVGASAGFSAGAAAPAAASFGLTAGGGTAAGGGFALAAAGGVASAVAAAQMVQTTAAAGAARQAFAVESGSTAAPRPGLPEQPRPPLQSSGMPSPARQAAAAPAPPPPRVDPRAASWGFSVPLRPRTGALAASQEAPPPVRAVPTVAPWIELPGGPAGARSAGSAGRRRPCGCAGSCGCRGGAR